MTDLFDLTESEMQDKSFLVAALKKHTCELKAINPEDVIGMIRRAALEPSELLAIHGYFGAAPHYFPCSDAYRVVCEAVRDDMQEGYADF